MPDLEPRQERSRSTLRRLLSATVRVLDSHGLEGATIPRIAAEAGVAPATVYRRFRDKEALLHAVFAELAADSERGTRALVDFKREDRVEDAAAAIVRVLLAQYKAHPGLMRAMVRFAENDASFRAVAVSTTARNFQLAIDAMLMYSAAAPAPAARRAVTFALLSVATCIEARELEPVSVWNELYPVSDEEFADELTRMLLVYLKAAM